MNDELEKIRAELAAANERSKANYERWMRSEEEAEARETVLRAELAARDELLREARDMLGGCDGSPMMRLRARIDAALKKGAENG